MSIQTFRLITLVNLAARIPIYVLGTLVPLAQGIPRGATLLPRQIPILVNPIAELTFFLLLYLELSGKTTTELRRAAALAAMVFSALNSASLLSTLPPNWGMVPQAFYWQTVFRAVRIVMFGVAWTAALYYFAKPRPGEEPRLVACVAMAAAVVLMNAGMFLFSMVRKGGGPESVLSLASEIAFLAFLIGFLRLEVAHQPANA